MISICFISYFDKAEHSDIAIGKIRNELTQYTLIVKSSTFYLALLKPILKQTRTKYVKLIGMTKDGVMQSNGIYPVWGDLFPSALAGFLEHHNTFVICTALVLWQPSCLYIPNVGKNR